MTRDLGNCIPGKVLEGLDVGKRGISTILKVYWVPHPCVGSWKSRTAASQKIAMIGYVSTYAEFGDNSMKRMGI
jgi:hypothetical protein